MDGLSSSFAGRRVLVTGHTGFKGSWLSLWLARLGARVTGYALAPDGEANLFTLADIASVLETHIVADVRDARAMREAVDRAQPEIVLHLAAQPLVRASYQNPADTWSTNVMGTVHLLDALRQCPSVRAVVVVTTDKCYENQEWSWGYRETDPLGGHDPYSASKAGTEIVAASYRRAFLAERNVLLATARAGNVIGGGDWSVDRLIPDAARAAAANTALRIRNPRATRPWQHVLEALHGYLLLGSRLLAGDDACAHPFNFGPVPSDNLPVDDVLRRLQPHWPGLHWEVEAPAGHAPHEANLLYLDAAKARQTLGWEPRWTLDEALAQTARWYAAVQLDPSRARTLTEAQLDSFCS